MEERKIFYIILYRYKHPRVIDVAKSSKYANGKRYAPKGEECTLSSYGWRNQYKIGLVIRFCFMLALTEVGSQ